MDHKAQDVLVLVLCIYGWFCFLFLVGMYRWRGRVIERLWYRIEKGRWPDWPL